jgi:hypothetical protein
MAAQYQLSRLLAVLQQGDVVAVSALLRGTTWGPADEAAQRQPGCGSAGEALATAKLRKADGVGVRLPNATRFGVSVDQIQISDSGFAIVIEGQLRVLGGPSMQAPERVRLLLDSEHLTWSAADGVLKGLCGGNPRLQRVP